MIGEEEGLELMMRLSARTKAAAEQMFLSADPTSTIIRPSIVFGPGDSFFNVGRTHHSSNTCKSSASLTYLTMTDETFRSGSQHWRDSSHFYLFLAVARSAFSKCCSITDHGAKLNYVFIDQCTLEM